MLILIAESKTMTPCDGTVSAEEYNCHRPVLGEQADALMDALRRRTVDALARDVKISGNMARRLQQMIYDFPHKHAGSKAIEAFTGVVFKAFRYAALTDVERSRTAGCVRIISSLYGWLRPDDVIKSYRFDFTTHLAPDGDTFASYWRKDVTACLLQWLDANGCDEVLNLLPADAARCIDWKAIEGKAAVLKADFKEIQSGGLTRTPNAGRLKTLRGELLRQIICENVTSLSALAGLESDHYMAESVQDIPGVIAFATASVR